MNRNFLTFDTDWCPDWAIEEIANLLVQKNIKSSWFITNDFSALSDLLQNPLFDIGIHPNFFPGSSHGSEPREILKFLKTLAPESKIVRSHSLYSSERHLQIMADEFEITHDCTLYLPGADEIRQHRLKYGDEGKEIIRAPHFFQDNMYFINNSGSFSLQDSFFNTRGLRIFNFHPIHYLLNTDSLKRYNNLKANLVMNKINKNDIVKFSNNSKGVRSLFNELIEVLTSEGSYKITEIK